jgi:hypothetical protein
VTREGVDNEYRATFVVNTDMVASEETEWSERTESRVYTGGIEIG